MDAVRSTPAPVLAPSWRISDGLVEYAAAQAVMRDQVAAIRAGEAPETVWLLEHPPLFTAGTSAQLGDLSNPRGFPTHDAGRGGQWTYHGPGQRVAYVMLDLAQPHGAIRPRDVRAYVWGLEEWLIRSLRALEVHGGRREGRVGIWVTRDGQDAKVAALGVRITRWVSWHGVAVNVAPNLSHFDGIVPCGIREHGVTSLRALGSDAALADLDAALRVAWDGVFG